MIMIIDNYDSFVYNLARYLRLLGFETSIFRNNALSISDISKLSPSHIVISPGPCAPKQAGISLDLIKHFHKTIPILGVCLGHQAIAEAFGGAIIHAKKPLHGQSSLITHNQSGIFKGLPNPLKVGRYHSLIVDPSSIPSCLHITANSEEGEIMAIHHQQYPIVGVQFHPESVLTEHGASLLNNFLKIA